MNPTNLSDLTGLTSNFRETYIYIYISGITINEVIAVLTQFADDTTMYLRYEPLTLNEIANMLTIVEKNLGLKVSYDKTRLYRIGSLAGSDATLYTARSYIWSNEPIDTLGIQIACDGKEVPDNYGKVIEKVTSTCGSWYLRTLSLSGKIKVINTLVASLFVN